MSKKNGKHLPLLFLFWSGWYSIAFLLKAFWNANHKLSKQEEYRKLYCFIHLAAKETM
jgi:hypothetical protein